MGKKASVVRKKSFIKKYPEVVNFFRKKILNINTLRLRHKTILSFYWLESNQTRVCGGSKSIDLEETEVKKQIMKAIY